MAKKPVDGKSSRRDGPSTSLVPWSGRQSLTGPSRSLPESFGQAMSMPDKLRRLIALLTELLKFDADGLETEVREATVVCVREILAEVRTLVEVSRRGGDQAELQGLAFVLVRLAGAPWEEIGVEWHALWLQACLGLAPRIDVPDWQEMLTAAAGQFAPTDKDVAEIANFSLLLQARSYLQAGNAFLATVVAGELEERGACPEMVLAAKEIVAKAHAHEGNRAGELEVLKGWWEFARRTLGGAIRQAGRFQAMGSGAETRGEEMLQAAGRLGHLCELAGDVGGALEVYDEFIGMCLGGWAEPAEPKLGTIQGRAQRLRQAASAPGERPAHSGSLAVIRVDRDFGEFTSETWNKAVSVAMDGNLGKYRFLVTSSEHVNGNRFEVGTLEAQAHEVLAAVATEVVTAGSWGNLGLRFHAAREDGGEVGHGLGWVIAEHAVAGVPELRLLVFAVRPVVVGKEMQLSVYSGIGLAPFEAAPGREVLPRENRGDMATIPGFETLRDAVVEVLLEAGRRLESRNTARE